MKINFRIVGAAGNYITVEVEGNNFLTHLEVGQKILLKDHNMPENSCMVAVDDRILVLERDVFGSKGYSITYVVVLVGQENVNGDK